MQSLLSMKTCVGLRLSVLTDSEARIRTQWVNCWNRRNWSSAIVSCASERNGKGGMGASGASNSRSFLSPSHNYAILKYRMELAAKSEYYEEAARIRDSLKCFEDEVPLLRLRRLLKEAIADQRFQDAARYRDELKAIAPHSLLKCSSEATTLGIQVQVRSSYIEGRSQPSEEVYFFEYRIRITNNTNRPVQLLRRHWIITDANGKTENFWGIGVVGEQPAIFPRSSFEFSSTCPLNTQNGTMEGDFEMIHVDRVGSRAFNVAIAPFSLSLLGDGDEPMYVVEWCVQNSIKK
ncbi:apaG, partial [Mucuna pruriens]